MTWAIGPLQGVPGGLPDQPAHRGGAGERDHRHVGAHSQGRAWFGVVRSALAVQHAAEELGHEDQVYEERGNVERRNNVRASLVIILECHRPVVHWVLWGSHATRTGSGSRLRPSVPCCASGTAAGGCGTSAWPSRRPPAAGGEPCGSAGLDKQLTGWRAEYDWLRAGSSVAQKQTVRDYGRSRAKALKDIKDKLPVKQRAGMPRFRKRDRSQPTMNYTRQGFALRDGNLALAGGITVRVVWSRELPSPPSSVRVCRDSLGHWHASFVVETGTQPLPGTGRVLGVDWGVKEIATTTSPAHDLPHPQFGRKAAAGLARYQRQMARRRPARGQKASAGYKRARRQAAKTHAKVAAQRQDTARKWAKSVARDFDHIAVEDFKPKFLAKSTMAKKAADAAIGAAKRPWPRWRPSTAGPFTW
jgi:Probable transposase